MPERHEAPDWALRWEWAGVLTVCALALMSIPLALGHIGISWDALNHHIYLGWTAERPRFDRDYLAAGYQTYQYPYLYWPVYRLAVSGVSGGVAGLVVALLNVPLVPALWLLAKACVSGRDWFHVGMRLIAVVLAFTSAVVLSMLDTTGNDLLAAMPVTWAIAIGVHAVARADAAEPALTRWACISGLLAGIGTAFKLSNAFVAVVLPLLWLWPGRGLKPRVRRTTLGCLAAVLAFAVTFAPWGWQVWQQVGNPFFPLYDHWFAPLREWSGWQR